MLYRQTVLARTYHRTESHTDYSPIRQGQIIFMYYLSTVDMRHQPPRTITQFSHSVLRPSCSLKCIFHGDRVQPGQPNHPGRPVFPTQLHECPTDGRPCVCANYSCTNPTQNYFVISDNATDRHSLSSCIIARSIAHRYNLSDVNS